MGLTVPRTAAKAAQAIKSKHARAAKAQEMRRSFWLSMGTDVRWVWSRTRHGEIKRRERLGD